MLYRKRGWANTDRHVLGVARAMGEQWVACSVGISYAIRKLHSPARSAGGCERWSCVLRRSGASSSTARRERLGYWVRQRR